MSTTVYLVRHAEVENPKRIEYMRLPGFGLSKFGVEQAKEIKQEFDSKNISKIYASPLERTKQTAKILSGGRINIQYFDDFLEANFTKWQGVKRADRPTSEVEGYFRNPIKYSIVLGESLLDIQKRVVKRVLSLLKKHRGESIIIVTHAVPIVTTRLFFEKKSLMEFNNTIVNFASVTTIEFDDELKCKSIRYNEFVPQRKA